MQAQQPTRQDILDLVAQRGGIHKTQLCLELERSWGTISHHLNVLERRGEIDLERHGRRLFAFRKDTTRWQRGLVVALADPGRIRVLEELAERDVATVQELSRDLDASQKAIRTHLSHLLVAGAVQRRGNYPHYYSVLENVWNCIRRQLR